jgi:two-component sensor histidine kinase
MAWQSKQPAVLRWLGAIAFFGVALAGRLALGTFYGGMPSLTFYPMLLIVAAIFGWKEALAVLCLSVMAGIYLFLPPDMLLQPVGWLLVGGLTIAIITALKALTQELAAANARQRLLFRELQHRVANTLQSVAGSLEIARRKIDPTSGEASNILEETVRRITASAKVHRRLNDPALFERGLRSILQDAVVTVIDSRRTNLSLDVEELGLSYDQMSVITMIVIEIANNAQKHVFERDLGSNFLVSLRALWEERVVLSMQDDGPGWSPGDSDHAERSLGLIILRGLTDQLHGTLRINSGQKGTEVSVVFPTSARVPAPHTSP